MMLTDHVCRGVSQGSNHNIKQAAVVKNSKNHTAYSLDKLAVLRLHISCHFHIHFSVTAYVLDSVSVLWGAGVAALQACQHFPLLLTPPGDAAIPKCPSVLLPPPARSVCVCARLYLAQVHTHLHCRTVCGLPPSNPCVLVETVLACSCCPAWIETYYSGAHHMPTDTSPFISPLISKTADLQLKPLLSQCL